MERTRDKNLEIAQKFIVDKVDAGTYRFKRKDGWGSGEISAELDRLAALFDADLAAAFSRSLDDDGVAMAIDIAHQLGGGGGWSRIARTFAEVEQLLPDVEPAESQEAPFVYQERPGDFETRRHHGPKDNSVFGRRLAPLEELSEGDLCWIHDRWFKTGRAGYPAGRYEIYIRPCDVDGDPT